LSDTGSILIDLVRHRIDGQVLGLVTRQVDRPDALHRRRVDDVHVRTVILVRINVPIPGIERDRVDVAGNVGRA